MIDLGGIGWVLLFLLCFVAALPALLLSKAIGEILGIGVSPLLEPLFAIPKSMRAAGILSLAILLHWKYPLPIVLQVLLIISISLGTIFNLLSAEKYRSFEAHILFAVLGAYAIYLCFRLAGHWTESLTIQVIATCLLFSLPSYFLRSLQRAYTMNQKAHAQRIRDKAARKVAEKVTSGETPPSYCLYLRGFLLDEVLAPRLPDWAQEGGRFTSGKPVLTSDFQDVSDLLDETTQDNLESVLRASSRRFGSLVAIERSETAFGAGRLKATGSDWKDAIAKLMMHAKVIFVVPVNRPGTIWEIKHIVSNSFLHKTVFLNPGNFWVSLADEESSGAVSYQDHWDGARQKLKKYLDLPIYTDTPGLFMLNGDSSFSFAPGHWDNSWGFLAVIRTKKSLTRLLRSAEQDVADQRPARHESEAS